MLKVYTGTSEESTAYLYLEDRINNYPQLDIVDINGQILTSVGYFSSKGLVLNKIDFHIAKKYNIPTDFYERMVIIPGN